MLQQASSGTPDGSSEGAPLRVVVLIASSCMLFTMFYSYAACVHASQCPPLPHLPTISNTWTHPPGNFLSRFVVSVVSLAFFALQFSLWLPSNPVKNSTWHRFVGCLAVLCLSGVGAICDDTNPQCRGWPIAHDIIAVTFFVLYNYNMIIFSFHHSGRARVALALPALLSIASKVTSQP